MTTTSGSSVSEIRPRLVCRIVRQWCAVSNTMPEHASTCPGCLAYFAAVDELDSALRRDAAQSRRHGSASSSAFEQQILRAIRSSAQEHSRSRYLNTTRLWTIGGLCAAAAMAIVLSLPVGPDTAQSARSASVASSTADAAAILSTVESLSTGLVNSVIPSAGELMAHNPLQQELGSVYSDMRSALDFLALNFLPATPMKSTPPPARQI